MTRTFVANASVAVGWVHPAPATRQTAAMLDAIAAGATLEVPALWPMEVANALIVLVRRRKLRETERQTGLGWLRGLRLRIDHEMATLALSRLSELAAAHQLRSTTPRTWSWHSDGNSCGAVRTVPCERRQSTLASACGIEAADAGPVRPTP